MVRSFGKLRIHYERNQKITVRPEPVEGPNQRLLKYLYQFAAKPFYKLSTNGVVLSLLLLICCIDNCYAVDVYQLPNPEQQQAYETLTQELRCLVCQNQNIADSNAELAGDLRRQVFEMLQQGKSKEEIVTFMTDRYGDFVLYNPPLKTKTGLLWLGPAVFLLLGFFMVFWVIRRRKKIATVNLSPEQRAKIQQLLDDEEQH